MNQVALFGRLTRDPEIRYTQQGKAVVNFSLAVNRYGGNEADFFDCVAWEKQAENINNSCKKGHRLLIWGHLQQDRWTDQQTNQSRTAVKITVSGFSYIEPPPQQTQTQPPAGPPPYGPPGYQQQPAYPPQQGPQQGYLPQQPGGAYPNYAQPPQGQYAGRPGTPQQGQAPMQSPAAGQPGPMGNQGGYTGNLDNLPF